MSRAHYFKNDKLNDTEKMIKEDDVKQQTF